jgi:hypothetical protein
LKSDSNFRFFVLIFTKVYDRDRPSREIRK